MEDICKTVHGELETQAKECRCADCARLCTTIPGNYSPWQFDLPRKSDNEKTATSKIKKLHQTFATCIQHYFPHAKKDAVVFFLRPKQAHEAKSARVTLPEDGPCVHLGATGCKLARKEMPLGCTSVYGCKPEKATFLTGAGIEIAWNTKQGRAVSAAFEAYQHSQKMSVGKDQLFIKEYDMYALGCKFAELLVQSETSKNPLCAASGFQQAAAQFSSYSPEEQANVKKFAATTYALFKSQPNAPNAA